MAMLTINRNNMTNMNADKIDHKKKVSKKSNTKSFNAGNLNLGQSNALEEKRNRARKQAMKLISDAWERDEKASKGISDMQNQQTAVVDKIHELSLKIKDIGDSKEALREEYGIEEDSQEQKDLLLLEKYQDNMTGASFDDFSEEEINGLKELQNTPLTEYQKRALELNRWKGSIRKEIRQNENSLIAITSSIRDARIDQLKSQDMLNSQAAADKVLEASSKEIIGMLLEDVKEHLDEVEEENQEQAEKAEEKKEEKEEVIEKAKEKRKEQEKILKEQQKATREEADLKVEDQAEVSAEQVQKDIQKILNDNCLVNEDLKGIEIDLNF